MRCALGTLAIALAVLGCRATPGDVPVDIANLSPEAVTVVTEEPGPFLFPNTVTHVIPPWKEGRCFAHFRLYQGRIKVTVSGAGITTPLTHEATAGSADDGVAVRIDRDGNAQVVGSVPPDVLPCVMEGG